MECLCGRGLRKGREREGRERGGGEAGRGRGRQTSFGDGGGTIMSETMIGNRRL